MTNETTMTDHEIQIIREAIVALIRHREFLGYQLCHANGGMDDDQLEEIAKKYLAERHYPDDDLHDRLVVLKQLVGELDPEVAATMLQCPIEQVLNAWPTELE
jgi:ferredoxin-thioredoxin reductase catalytic subunit